MTQAHGTASGVWLFACTGMRRSGSTLQAMLVARLAGKLPIEVTSLSHAGELLADPGCRSRRQVLKCHAFIPQFAELQERGEAMIFHTYRDIRDVVASVAKKYGIPGFSFVHGGAARILSEHRAWCAVKGVYLSRYEDSHARLDEEVLRLAQHMGVPLSAAEASAIAAEYSVERQQARIDEAFAAGQSTVGEGDNRRDRSSLLHRNHIQSGGSGAYREVLSPREIAALEWVCRDWMRAMGYRADFPVWLQLLAIGSYRIHAAMHRLRKLAGGRGNVKQA